VAETAYCGASEEGSYEGHFGGFVEGIVVGV